MAGAQLAFCPAQNPACFYLGRPRGEGGWWVGGVQVPTPEAPSWEADKLLGKPLAARFLTSPPPGSCAGLGWWGPPGVFKEANQDPPPSPQGATGRRPAGDCADGGALRGERRRHGAGHPARHAEQRHPVPDGVHARAGGAVPGTGPRWLGLPFCPPPPALNPHFGVHTGRPQGRPMVV